MLRFRIKADYRGRAPTRLYTRSPQMSMDPTPGDDVVYFGEYVAVVRRRKWWVAACLVIGVVAAAAYYKLAPRVYDSTAKVQVTQVLPVQSAAQKIDMTTEASLVTSNDVIKCATLLFHNADFQKDPTSASIDTNSICSAAAMQKQELKRGVLQDLTVTPLPQSTVLQIQFSGPGGPKAQIGAQAFALGYIQLKTSSATSQLDRLRAPLLKQQKDDTRQLGKIETSISKEIVKLASATTPQARASEQVTLNGLNQQHASTQQALNQVTQQLLQLDPSKLTPPTVILPAANPPDPSSPNKYIDGAAGVAIGLLLGLGRAFIIDKRDDHVRGRQDVENALGVPVIAVIPHVPGWRNKNETQLSVTKQPRGTVAEAYRQLRTSISYIANQRDAKTFMVTGPGVGEGKTTTSANLAVVLALAGKKVILVSADLRKPRLHKFFGLENDNGLSNILAENIDPWTVIKNPSVENLRVITSGPIFANPSELLESERMVEFLQRLRDVSDFVIVDTPPVLVVADPLSISRAVDGVLVVVDAHESHRGALVHARDQLEQAGANVVGAVMNNFEQSKAKKYGSRYYGGYYSYGYRYGYGGYGYGRYGGYTSEQPAPVAPTNGSSSRPVETPAELRDSGNP